MDRSTKFILAAIAAGLWANAAAFLFHPTPARADQGDEIAGTVKNIADDLHAIYYGNCSNRKIC